MELDDLDHRLLDAFAAAFPRPSEIPFCDYDVERARMQELCTADHPHENHSLMSSFICHNRWGLFGDWTHFPAFAGHLAVSARRRGFDHEHDLTFFFLHTSACGHFQESLFPLMSEWTTDILCPWQRERNRGNLFEWKIHAIGYLGIHCNVGGDPADILQQNLDRSRQNAAPTELLSILAGHFLADADPLFEYFRSARKSADNQELPAADCRFVPVKHLRSIQAALETARSEIEPVCSKC